eukprot:TRINITY_DN308_c3_g1_i1.p1 TRINITY_DN308_c3_g1~~TRINITY_DN308_c3_g1_i1.p1  ORF type:complete len:858 (+),score=192.35 TRINITY_DN308_c3_g1_i1:103-2676(+)
MSDTTSDDFSNFQWVINVRKGAKFSWTDINSVLHAVMWGDQRKRQTLEFVCENTGDRVLAMVRRVPPESVFLAQIKKQVNSEKGLRNAMGRTIQHLKAAESRPVGICFNEDPYLTDWYSNPLVGVLRLLTSVGGNTQYKGYDIVFDELNAGQLAAVKSLRQALEKELDRLRWETGKFKRSKSWKQNRLESRLPSYEPVVLKELQELRAILASEEELDAAAKQDYMNRARDIWEWCLASTYYEHFCTSQPASPTASPPESAEASLMRLNLATNLLCSIYKKCTTATQDSSPMLFTEQVQKREGGPGVGTGDFPHSKSDVPTEPAGDTFWRMTELFGHPDPAKRKRSSPYDPVVLINTDGSCWLNSVLIPLNYIILFRRLIYSVTPYKAVWQDPGNKYITQASDAQNSAMKFIHRLQALFSFMGEESCHKYAFNLHVREAFEEYAENIGASGFGSGLADASEFLMMLPELLITAIAASPEASKNLNGQVQQLFNFKTVTHHLKHQDPSDTSTGIPDYPILVHPDKAEKDLNIMIMKAMETEGHSFKALLPDSMPEILVVVVRRKQWDKKFGRSFISQEEVDVPEELFLDTVSNDPTCVELRKEIMIKETLLKELQDYDPAVQLRIAPVPIPSVLQEELGEDEVSELQSILEKLAAKSRAAEEVRNRKLEETKKSLDELLIKLRERIATAKEWGSLRYSLTACVAYTDRGNGHYWSHVKTKGSWLRCDDKPMQSSPKSLPDFVDYTPEMVLEEVSTAGTCLFYLKAPKAADLSSDDWTEDGVVIQPEPDIPDHLLEMIASDNKKLDDWIAKASAPDPTDDEEDEEEEEEEEEEYDNDADETPSFTNSTYEDSDDRYISYC